MSNKTVTSTNLNLQKPKLVLSTLILQLTKQSTKLSKIHCVKSVRIQSFSGPCFPEFGLNAEIYTVHLAV